MTMTLGCRSAAVLLDDGLAARSKTASTCTRKTVFEIGMIFQLILIEYFLFGLRSDVFRATTCFHIATPQTQF
jgi:hypothetical protein